MSVKLTNSDTPLRRSADVVAVPGDTLGHVGVDAHGSEECTGVLEGVVGRGDLQDEAEDGDAVEKDHVDAALAVAVRQVAAADAADARRDVRGYRHQLRRLVVGEAQAGDDGREEQREGVPGNVIESVKPSLSLIHKLVIKFY